MRKVTGMGNGVFDGLADQYWAKVKPHAYDLAAVVKCYADEMLRELHVIANAVDKDDTPPLYYKYAGVVVPGTPAILVDDIVSGRELELCYASLVTLTGAQTQLLLNRDIVIRAIDTTFQSSLDGTGIIIRPGDTLSVITTLAGGTNYFVTLRERQVNCGRMSLGQQGAENPVKWQNGMHPDILSHIQDRNVKQAQNVIGANRGD